MSSELYQLIQRKNDLKSQDNLNGNNLTHIKTMIPPRPGLCGLWANPILQDNRIRAHIWLQLTCQTLPLRLRTQSFNNQGYSHILHWTPTRRSVEALEVFFSDTLSAEQVLFRNQSICGGSNQMTLHRCHLLPGVPPVGHPHPRITPLILLHRWSLVSVRFLWVSPDSFYRQGLWVLCLFDQEISLVGHERSTGLRHILC